MSIRAAVAQWLYPDISAELNELRATMNDFSLSLWSEKDWDKVFGSATTEENALQYSPVYRSVDLIANTVGKLPFVTYQVTADGKEPDRNHPAYKLLKHRANPFMSSFQLRHALTSHRGLHGNGYAFIERDQAGAPIGLWPLSPLNVEPKVLMAGDTMAGEVFYILKSSNGQVSRIDADDMIHIRGLGDFLQGYSVLALAATSFRMGKRAQEYSESFFANDASPGMVIEHPGKLKQESVKSLRDQWNSQHRGASNAHKLAVLQDGMSLKTFHVSARDSQLLETMQFSLKDVANWFGVPAHKIGDNSRAAYNTLEQENQSFLDDTIDAHLVNWETETREKLLTEREKDAESHFTRFKRQALVRADLRTRGEYYVKALGGHPWATLNEIRGLEDMNKVEGGDEIKPPTNNFSDAPEPVTSTSNDDAARAAEEHLESEVRRMRDRLVRDKELSRTRFRDKHEGVVDDALRGAGKVLDYIYSQPIGTTAAQCKTELLEEFGI